MSQTNPSQTATSTAAVAALTGPALLRRGGRTLPDISFKTFYFGRVWEDDPRFPDNPHVAARKKIDETIAVAMADGSLNGCLAEYFPGKPITATALESDIIIDDDRTARPNLPFNEIDIRKVVMDLLPARLAGVDLATTAVNIVLPQGMSLEMLGLDGRERPAGTTVMDGVPTDMLTYSSAIAGYHGSVAAEVAGEQVQVIYSVVVWSDGNFGIPVPGWEGWENIVATLYHELQEIRTDPDVDCAIRTGDNKFIGFSTDPVQGPDGSDCREIADLPLILLPLTQMEMAFTRVNIATGDGTVITVPIQRLWSSTHRKLVPD
jgi:hypothetical protein